MMALMSKTVDLLNAGCSVVIRAGSRECGLMDEGYGLPEGCQRIPLETFTVIAHKHDVEWVQPTTSTQGYKVVEQKIRGYVDSMMEPPEKKTSEAFHPSLITGGVSKHNSLMDVHNKRVRMRERSSRFQ